MVQHYSSTSDMGEAESRCGGEVNENVAAAEDNSDNEARGATGTADGVRDDGVHGWCE